MGYLDPPEVPEIPECCGDEMVYHEDGTLTCPHCGDRQEPLPDPPNPEPILEALPDPGFFCEECDNWARYSRLCDKCASKARCPHGNLPGDCNTCDFEADIAYDAWREST